MKIKQKTWMVTAVSSSILCTILGILCNLKLLYAAASIFMASFFISIPVYYSYKVKEVEDKEKYYQHNGSFGLISLFCIFAAVLFLSAGFTQQ